MELVLDYFDKGGLIFLILGILSLISVTMIFYKFFDIYYLSNLNLKKLFYYKMQPESLGDLEDLLLLKEFKNKNALEEVVYFLKDLNKSNKKEDEINFYLSKKFENIQFLMPSLEIISQVSPLIGLLGTVIGMIDSFNELELGGSLVDPSILAGGIWTALLTTAVGLLVAIPALVSHYFFEKKINQMHEFYYFFLTKFSTK